jgi:hypothetical protein
MGFEPKVFFRYQRLISIFLVIRPVEIDENFVENRTQDSAEMCRNNWNVEPIVKSTV